MRSSRNNHVAKKRRWLFTKSTTLIILFVLMANTIFGGWHSKNNATAFKPPESFDFSKNYEITFWAKNDTNVVQNAVYAKAIKDFEALYPNIKVNIKLYTDYSRLYNDVLTNISTNTTPNVCVTYPDHIATYLSGEDRVVALDVLFDDPKFGFGGSEVRFDGPVLSEMVEEFMDECYLAGHYYAVPYMRSTEACYINKDYVEALGYQIPDILTWDFIWEVSEAAMVKDESVKIGGKSVFKINGQTVMIPFIYKSTDNMMIQMLKQKGAGYSQPNGTVEIFNDDTKEILYEISKHAGTRAFSTFKISSYPANFLNAGQCIFAIDSTAGSTWMGSDAPLLDISADSLVKFETVVRPIPQYDVNNPKMISQGPSICIFNKQDPNEVVASWLFVQYLLTNEVQIGYSETEGYIPVTRKAIESPEYQEYLANEGKDNDQFYYVKLQATKLLLSNIDKTFVTPVFNGSTSLRDAAGQMIENVTKSTRRKEKIDESYMSKLFTDITSLYKLDQIVITENPVDERVEAGGDNQSGNNQDSDSQDSENHGNQSSGSQNENGQSVGNTGASVNNGNSGTTVKPDNSSSGKEPVTPKIEDLGPLPKEAKRLIATLISLWVLMIAYVATVKVRHKSKNNY